MRGNVAKRPDGKYRARYRDATGREHARHFTRRKDAWSWLRHVTSPDINDLVTGADIDTWLPLSREEADDLLAILSETSRLRVAPSRLASARAISQRLKQR